MHFEFIQLTIIYCSVWIPYDLLRLVYFNLMMNIQISFLELKRFKIRVNLKNHKIVGNNFTWTFYLFYYIFLFLSICTHIHYYTHTNIPTMWFMRGVVIFFNIFFILCIYVMYKYLCIRMKWKTQFKHNSAR